MIKFVGVILAVLNTTSVYANTKFEYDSHSAEGIKSIYWLSENKEKAIVYADFEGFHSFKELIDNTILTSNTSTKTVVNLVNADKILLMMPKQKKILEIYLADDHLVFNNLNYELDSRVISKLKATNEYRVNKGDLISTQSLIYAKKNFGNHN